MNIQILQDTIIPILKEHDVSFAGLFGSYSRGEERPDSDLDILVRFGRPKSLLDLVRLERMVSEKLNCPVEVVTEDSLSHRIRDSVHADLRVLYET